MSGGNDDRSMLDSLISSAAADEPSEEQLRRLEARIAPLFVTGAGTGTGVAAAAKAGKSTLAKWLAGGLTVGALGAGGYAVHRSMQASPPSTVGVDAAAPGFDAAPDAPVADAGLASTPAPTPKQATRAKSPPASADGLTEEARILARAQTALRDGNPARALRDIDRHQAKFPRGVLAEERERLAIETLLALGRRDAAEARARHFRSAFPDSLQWDRIRALLDGSK
jgi:hypothetical protein